MLQARQAGAQDVQSMVGRACCHSFYTPRRQHPRNVRRFRDRCAPFTMGFSIWLSLVASLPLLIYLYVRANDAKISHLPPEAIALSPGRWTDEDVQRVASSPALTSPSASLLALEDLPPKTGRRYIVIGGVSARLSIPFSPSVSALPCARCVWAVGCGATTLCVRCLAAGTA